VRTLVSDANGTVGNNYYGAGIRMNTEPGTDEALTRGQIRELRAQMRRDLACLRQHRKERGANGGHAEDHAERYARVLGALYRIDEGTYGFCIVCRRPIPVRRLKCVPDTSRCVTCRAAGPHPNEHR